MNCWADEAAFRPPPKINQSTAFFFFFFWAQSIQFFLLILIWLWSVLVYSGSAISILFIYQHCLVDILPGPSLVRPEFLLAASTGSSEIDCSSLSPQSSPSPLHATHHGQRLLPSGLWPSAKIRSAVAPCYARPQRLPLCPLRARSPAPPAQSPVVSLRSQFFQTRKRRRSVFRKHPAEVAYSLRLSRGCQ